MVKLLKQLRTNIRVKLKKQRCSGYKVYPNGTICKGCSDCAIDYRNTEIKQLKQVLKEVEGLLWGLGGFAVTKHDCIEKAKVLIQDTLAGNCDK